HRSGLGILADCAADGFLRSAPIFIVLGWARPRRSAHRQGAPPIRHDPLGAVTTALASQPDERSATRRTTSPFGRRTRLARWVLGRVLRLIAVLLLVSAATFGLVNALSGDPSAAILGQGHP